MATTIELRGAHVYRRNRHIGAVVKENGAWKATCAHTYFVWFGLPTRERALRLLVTSNGLNPNRETWPGKEAA